MLQMCYEHEGFNNCLRGLNILGSLKILRVEGRRSGVDWRVFLTRRLVKNQDFLSSSCESSDLSSSSFCPEV